MGLFGLEVSEPYVWIPLAAAFFFGLFDFSEPRWIVHLDLLVLLSFGASQFFWERGEVGLSAPLAYPPLVYLLCRMLWIGFRGARKGLRPTASISLLVTGLVFLLFFRVALNVFTSGVIDVSYSGVVGADRITHGETVWGKGEFPDDSLEGDTYGPVNYYAYVPFELALPWTSGYFDEELAAAHGAAIFFDLATVLGLFVFGRRIARSGKSDDEEASAAGTALGVTLAFAWCAYPYTTYALQSNSNDALTAALIVWAMVALASPVGRGVLLGVGTMAKFVPAALAPLFAVGERGLLERIRGRPVGDEPQPPDGPGLRPVVYFSLAFTATVALLLIHPAIDPGLSIFYERTLGNQLGRESYLSVWGQEPSLEWLQTTLKLAAAGLAVALAFVLRRRSPVQVAALAAAVLIAAQIAVDHWFYLYLPWFFGLVAIALATRDY